MPPPRAGPRRTIAKPEGSAESTNAPGSSATPGPSGRPPVQRLQSLTKRAPPGGSITPASRAPSALGADTGPKPLKFRPKAVQRKSKEERDAIEKIEQERNNERLKEAAAIQRGKDNGRGRGSFRGRGGAMGGGVGGPLGSTFGGAFRGRGGGQGRGRMRSTFTAGSRGRDDDSSGDDLATSIDQINIESDDDWDSAEDVKGKMPSRGRRARGLRPVRVTRHEHEERVIHVNMESSSAKAAEIREKAQQEAAEEISSTEEDIATSQPEVKEEPSDENDLPMEDLPIAEDDGLPRQRYRVRRKTSDPKSAERKPVESKEVIPPTKVKRDPRELLRTKEEIDEYDRHLADLEHIRELLTHREPEPEPEPEAQPQAEPEAEAEKSQPAETDTNMDDGLDQDNEEAPIEKLANEHLLGHLFLMQFPPMTPNLSLANSNDAPAPQTTQSQPRPQAQPEVKTENGEDADVEVTGETVSDGPSKLITAATNWSLPAGRVGKLNVHKSGRVTMDWGGISFELDRAAAVDFVQEALIVSQPEPDQSGQLAKDDTRHQAWSMGQLSGKFTVMPNWDAML
ncbi:uncharacterized protein N7483_010849 [Penicillium malachiteum]|uniref:uncharacterized protein n=1 Tax=Penicillium malachiteum TaxID=1324776 RepID=UPI00254908FD|nr:uncharacterized protein N7483_010849 [Penicillium malachiteum]KAJ5713668.1 hypothetical protein N7483_010849 [Penicillium malachiteum]